MYALIKRMDRLAFLVRHHIIKVKNINKLGNALLVRPNVPYQKSDAFALQYVATQMWYRFGFNFFLFQKMIESYYCFNTDLYREVESFGKIHDLASFISVFSHGGNYNQFGSMFIMEGVTAKIDEQGNVVLMSNHYGDNNQQRYPVCSDFSIETFEWIQKELFPGFFDWRLFYFDRIQVEVHQKSFHRGCCLQIIFRADNRIVEYHPDLIKHLKKQNIPPSHCYIPKKRKQHIYPPLPPTIEFKALERVFSVNTIQK
jgi:hypothetical protein